MLCTEPLSARRVVSLLGYTFTIMVHDSGPFLQGGKETGIRDAWLMSIHFFLSILQETDNGGVKDMKVAS